jgi:hypothetical protein
MALQKDKAFFPLKQHTLVFSKIWMPKIRSTEGKDSAFYGIHYRHKDIGFKEY